MKGWVYVITNKAMPGLIKVGYTMKDPELRANDLNHTGSPHPYFVDYEVLVQEPRGVEQTVHAHLKDRREGKEWFRCSTEEAISAIKSVVGSKAEVENFKRADRAKAEAVWQRKEAEERARRTADEERRKREAVFDVKRQEITSRYEASLKSALPDTNFLASFGGVLAMMMMALAVLFPKFGLTENFMLSTIGAFFVARFFTERVESWGKDSDEYKSIIAKRDAELAALESNSKRHVVDLTARHRVPSGGIKKAQLASTRSNEPEMEYECSYCGHITVQSDSHIGECRYCGRTGYAS